MTYIFAKFFVNYIIVEEPPLETYRAELSEWMHEHNVTTMQAGQAGR
jgi:hypothetical protein